MNTGKLISEFLSQKKVAVAGISRSGRGFGNAVFNELRSRDYEVYPVHPQAPDICS